MPSLKAHENYLSLKRSRTALSSAPEPLSSEILSSDLIHREANALFQACKKIGAVTIQHHQGTIGVYFHSNRCHHYNQSAFQQACHKDGGKICYAREDADRCNSTCQSDGTRPDGAWMPDLRWQAKIMRGRFVWLIFIPMRVLGRMQLSRMSCQKEIIIPLQGGRSAYQRLSYPSAIDYPIVCAGVRLTPSAEKADEIENARIVGAMGVASLHCPGIIVS